MSDYGQHDGGQYGVISSVNDRFVFVRYSAGDAAEATLPRDLYLGPSTIDEHALVRGHSHVMIRSGAMTGYLTRVGLDRLQSVIDNPDNPVGWAQFGYFRIGPDTIQDLVADFMAAGRG